MKFFTVILFFAMSLGLFYTPKVYADEPGYRTEIVFIDGQWYEITYGPDGGIVTIKIHHVD